MPPAVPRCRLPLALACAAGGLAEDGNLACWGGGFSYDSCCAARHGPEGNKACWDEVHTHASCCFAGGGGAEAEAQGGLEALLRLGEEGDATVLPKLMQSIAHGDLLACEQQQAPAPELRCAGTGRGPSGAAWRALFRAQAATKLVGAGHWPEEADPWKLFRTCCLGADASEVLADMEADCAFGTVALLTAAATAIEEHLGTEAARVSLAEAEAVRARHWHLQAFDCHWVQQVNHDLYRHVGWFLGAPPGGRLPCRGPRIFVEGRGPLGGLAAAPLGCARRGLCFTEVWIHQYLVHSSCRVESIAEADFVYVPIYGSCYELDQPSVQQMQVLQQLFQMGAEAGPPLLLVFSCEMWKLKGWKEALRQRSILAVVESQPLLRTAAAGAPPAGGAEARLPEVHHCKSCFRKDVDFVIPSAVPPGAAARLRAFSREPKDRELLLCFHGEHAASTTRGDVAMGYREVNETVRLALLSQFQDKPDVSVGGPSLAYAFVMGNSHFCLVPKGRGWWTVRLYEAFYAGCIPVLLSDNYATPFNSFLDWSELSLKWPMRQTGDELYEHLQGLVSRRWPVVEALHRRLREAACWFDFHAPASADCSPYLGLAAELGRRKREWEASGSWPDLPLQQPAHPEHDALVKYWF